MERDHSLSFARDGNDVTGTDAGMNARRKVDDVGRRCVEVPLEVHDDVRGRERDENEGMEFQ